MVICDVCSAPTSWEEGTGYTAVEFRKIISMGFEPDDKIINLAEALGKTKQQAIADWKNGLVANSTTGWLLCPSCASRASQYMFKPAGVDQADHKLTELVTPEMLGLSSTSWKPAQKKWWQFWK